MRRSPRYPPGRQLLVRGPVCPIPSSPVYMAVEIGRRRLYTTHRARLVSVDVAQQRFLVEVEGECEGKADAALDTYDSGIQLWVPQNEVFRLNSGQSLPCVNGEVKLEDGIRCKYR
jgi:hypothetical protein